MASKDGAWQPDRPAVEKSPQRSRLQGALLGILVHESRILIERYLKLQGRVQGENVGVAGIRFRPQMIGEVGDVLLVLTSS